MSSSNRISKNWVATFGLGILLFLSDAHSQSTDEVGAEVREEQQMIEPYKDNADPQKSLIGFAQNETKPNEKTPIKIPKSVYKLAKNKPISFSLNEENNAITYQINRNNDCNIQADAILKVVENLPNEDDQSRFNVSLVDKDVFDSLEATGICKENIVAFNVKFQQRREVYNVKVGLLLVANLFSFKQIFD